MLSEKEVALVFETLLSSPGMNDIMKLDLRMPRKNVLFLAKVIERGLQVKKGEPMEGLLQAAGTQVPQELEKVTEDLLQKAGLAEMNEKLVALQHPGLNK